LGAAPAYDYYQIPGGNAGMYIRATGRDMSWRDVLTGQARNAAQQEALRAAAEAAGSSLLVLPQNTDATSTAMLMSAGPGGQLYALQPGAPQVAPLGGGPMIGALHGVAAGQFTALQHLSQHMRGGGTFTTPAGLARAPLYMMPQASASACILDAHKAATTMHGLGLPAVLTSASAPQTTAGHPRTLQQGMNQHGAAKTAIFAAAAAEASQGRRASDTYHQTARLDGASLEGHANVGGGEDDGDGGCKSESCTEAGTWDGRAPDTLRKRLAKCESDDSLLERHGVTRNTVPPSRQEHVGSAANASLATSQSASPKRSSFILSLHSDPGSRSVASTSNQQEHDYEPEPSRASSSSSTSFKPSNTTHPNAHAQACEIGAYSRPHANAPADGSSSPHDSQQHDEATQACSPAQLSMRGASASDVSCAARDSQARLGAHAGNMSQSQVGQQPLGSSDLVSVASASKSGHQEEDMHSVACGSNTSAPRYQKQTSSRPASPSRRRLLANQSGARPVPATEGGSATAAGPGGNGMRPMAQAAGSLSMYGPSDDANGGDVTSFEDVSVQSSDLLPRSDSHSSGSGAGTANKAALEAVTFVGSAGAPQLLSGSEVSRAGATGRPTNPGAVPGTRLLQAEINPFLQVAPAAMPFLVSDPTCSFAHITNPLNTLVRTDSHAYALACPPGLAVYPPQVVPVQAPGGSSPQTRQQAVPSLPHMDAQTGIYMSRPVFADATGRMFALVDTGMLRSHMDPANAFLKAGMQFAGVDAAAHMGPPQALMMDLQAPHASLQRSKGSNSSAGAQHTGARALQLQTGQSLAASDSAVRRPNPVRGGVSLVPGHSGLVHHSVPQGSEGWDCSRGADLQVAASGDTSSSAACAEKPFALHAGASSGLGIVGHGGMQGATLGRYGDFLALQQRAHAHMMAGIPIKGPVYESQLQNGFGTIQAVGRALQAENACPLPDLPRRASSTESARNINAEATQHAQGTVHHPHQRLTARSSCDVVGRSHGSRTPAGRHGSMQDGHRFAAHAAKEDAAGCGKAGSARGVAAVLGTKIVSHDRRKNVEMKDNQNLRLSAFNYDAVEGRVHGLQDIDGDSHDEDYQDDKPRSKVLHAGKKRSAESSKLRRRVAQRGSSAKQSREVDDESSQVEDSGGDDYDDDRAGDNCSGKSMSYSTRRRSSKRVYEAEVLDQSAEAWSQGDDDEDMADFSGRHPGRNDREQQGKRARCGWGPSQACESRHVEGDLSARSMMPLCMHVL
jgi:hypothetical protein